jgi:lipid II:glycine glycyltransferase (peptidoglycan interpeptide bridge formation enzyme)
MSDADMVTFFSYSDVLPPAGFSKKEGLTSIINLSSGEKAVWEGMRRKFIREQIQKGERNGISIDESKDFAAFERIYASFREKKGISADNITVFKDNGLLFLARLGDETLAGGVFIYDDLSIRAWALASKRFEGNGRMRELTGQANRMVIWEAIHWACQHGIVNFDLGGLDNSVFSGNPSTLAVFKEAFGGERKPSYFYSKIYSPLLKVMLRLSRLR